MRRTRIPELTSGLEMSIKSKLYAGFALLVLIAVALAVYGITEFNVIKSNVAKMKRVGGQRDAHLGDTKLSRSDAPKRAPVCL